MLKKFMAVAAVSGLALTSALAQSTAPSSSTTPSATNPAPTSSAAAPSTPSSGSAQFVTKQSADQHLASKFKGTDVVGSDDKKIGDVSDVLFDKDKKILAYIVGVGGFLGIGAKDVAIDPAAFQPVAGTDTNASDFKLRLSMTKDELNAAPAFEPYSPPRPVTSQAPATRPMGAPAPTAPANKQ